jgi:hypothetical protein
MGLNFNLFVTPSGEHSNAVATPFNFNNNLEHHTDNTNWNSTYWQQKIESFKNYALDLITEVESGRAYEAVKTGNGGCEVRKIDPISLANHMKWLHGSLQNFIAVLDGSEDLTQVVEDNKEAVDVLRDVSARMMKIYIINKAPHELKNAIFMQMLVNSISEGINY